MSSNKKNILVTGFGLFGVHKVNASWSVAQELEHEVFGDGFKIIIHQLPVEYDYVQREIPKLWEKYNPILVVHLGVHSFANTLILETSAHNSEYERTDVCGCLPENGCCMLQAPATLSTTLNLKSAHQQLTKTLHDVQLSLSDDPGRFLCDFTYFCSLAIDRERVAFIHVPCLDSPYSLQQLTNGVKAIIHILLQQVLDPNKS